VGGPDGPDMWADSLPRIPDITLAERGPAWRAWGTPAPSITCSSLLTNVKMRQAVLAVADQADFMNRIRPADQQNWKLCPSFFTCGTPMGEQCRRRGANRQARFSIWPNDLSQRAGYKGEKIVVLDAGRQRQNPHAHALVAADLLKRLGLNVEIAAQRLGQSGHPQGIEKSRLPKAAGNVFGSGWVGADMPRSGAQTRPCAAMGKRRGLAGLRTTRSKPCEANG